MGMIHIILAEDHQIVRNGIRALLEKEGDFGIAGEAVNGRQVIELLNSGVTADIVLADISMPEVSGIDLISLLKKSARSCKVIILSVHDHEKYVIQAFRAGAHGYLLKSIDRSELVFAIRQVHAGSQYICSALSTQLLNRLMAVPGPEVKGLSENMAFSSREVEILSLIAQGLTNQEIADKLFTSKRTVEGHRQALIDRTGARNTAALIRFALVNRIIN
jgi:DNA-binding NarL/FixJ family response regulator